MPNVRARAKRCIDAFLARLYTKTLCECVKHRPALRELYDIVICDMDPSAVTVSETKFEAYMKVSKLHESEQGMQGAGKGDIDCWEWLSEQM